MAAAIGEGRETSESELRDACAACRRYFVDALPLHVRDEEHSILPRLRGRDDAVDQALAQMHLQHGEHDPLVAELVDALERVEADPTNHTARASVLRVAEALRADFEDHLRREETVIFPALERLLTPADRADILAELRARRSE